MKDTNWPQKMQEIYPESGLHVEYGIIGDQTMLKNYSGLFLKDGHAQRIESRH